MMFDFIKNLGVYIIPLILAGAPFIYHSLIEAIIEKKNCFSEKLYFVALFILLWVYFC